MFKLSEFGVVLAVAAVGVVAATVDLRTRRVPNVLTFGAASCGIGLAALGASPVGLGASVAALLLGLALMLPGHVIGATGAGDVKLFAALATFLGPGATAWAFLYAAIAGGVIALATAASRQSLRGTLMRTALFVRTGGSNAAEIEVAGVDNRFAYAPAIAIGALVAAVGGLGF